MITNPVLNWARKVFEKTILSIKMPLPAEATLGLKEIVNWFLLGVVALRRFVA